MMEVTFDQVCQAEEQLMVERSEEAIREGRGRIIDYWIVAYSKGDEQQKRMLREALEP